MSFLRFSFSHLIQFRFDYLVGCVIIHNDSKILASGQNEPNRTRNATRHAEMCALDTIFEQYDLSTAKKVYFLH